MKVRKRLFAEIIIFLTVAIFMNPAFSQVKKEGKILFSGVIESISEDLKFIVVNEARIFISPSSTKISDEWGNILNINDLRPKLHIIVEALQHPSGVFAKRILIKTSRRKY